MRTLLLSIFLFLPFMCFAQKEIILKQGKLTQFVFMSDINTYKISIPEKTACIVEGNVLYIQPLESFPSANLTIITADSCYFAYSLTSGETTSFNYLFVPDSATFNLSRAKTITTINPATPISPPNKGSALKVARSEDRIFDTILGEKGYIKILNAVKKKKAQLAIKGIYVHANKIYFRIELYNYSNVKYNIESVTFYSSIKKKGRLASLEKEQKHYISCSNDINSIPADSWEEFVYEFELFNISQDKDFFIDVNEINGDRTLSLPINSDFIINSKKI